MPVSAEPAIAFAAPANEAAFEVRVNFGVFAGRAATPAEIDELARRLVPDLGPVSIVSEERHEIGEAVEAMLHQVRIEVHGEQLPSGRAERETLARFVVDEAARWAHECITERAAPEAGV